MEFVETLIQILASSIRLAVPLICACLAGLWSERSGVVDIGLEGKMLGRGLRGGRGRDHHRQRHDRPAGGRRRRVSLSLVHGYACITQRGNQIVSGVAINMLAAGLAAVLGNAWFRRAGARRRSSRPQRFLPINLPFVDTLGAVPILGDVYRLLLSARTSSPGSPSSPCR